MLEKKNNSIKMTSELAKYKRYCKCGHSVILPPTSKRNRVICSHCNRWIYKNDYEEFKENIKKVLK